MPLLRALKTLVCVIYTMPSWSPFCAPPVGTMGVHSLCMACDYVSCCEHLFPLTNTTHFPICFHQRFGIKAAQHKPARLLSPSLQHLVGLKKSISLLPLVESHFGFVFIGRKERFRERLLQYHLFGSERDLNRLLGLNNVVSHLPQYMSTQGIQFL